MLRKPTHKKMKEQRKKEKAAFLVNSGNSTTPEGEGFEFIDAGPSSSRSGLRSSHDSLNKNPGNPGGRRLFKFNLKRKIMKSKLGKSLSRLDERRNSFEKEETSNKNIVTEKECHSAVEYLDHSSSSHNDLAGL